MNNELTKERSVREPLFHIEKQDGLASWKAWLIRGGAVLFALVVSGIVSAVLIKANPFEFFAMIFDGNFGGTLRIQILLRDTALLLGVSIAIVPAFRMRFWNLGANGQVLIGCLATTACMFYMHGKVPQGLMYVCMILASVVAGAVWAVLPAIFKAFFKTNESLFTLMMNYIAQGLVVYFLNIWAKDNPTGQLDPIWDGMFPQLGNQYVLPILVVAVLTALMFVYLQFSKQGYEISVVGESENTARYVGINVKKVIIRTMIISGVVCGIMGLLLSGFINGNVSRDMVDNRGFTAILVAWMSKFNPLVMIGVSFFVVFMDRGVIQAGRHFGVTNDAYADIITGIIFFFVIGCEFFIGYRLRRNKQKKEEGKK